MKEKQLNLFSHSYLTTKDLNKKRLLLTTKRIILYNSMRSQLFKTRDREHIKYITEKYKTDVSFLDDEISSINNELNKRGIKNEKNRNKNRK